MPIEIFYSYASTEDGVDERLQQQLERHLGVLKRQGKITNWNKRNIFAGQILSEEVNNHINSAQIILLLVSPDFVESDGCWDIEMMRALERQKEEKTLVIPVLLRPIDYKEAPFSKLRVLPRNGKPVTSWSNQDEAFADIAYNIRLLAENFEQTQKVSWKNLGIGISLATAIALFVTSSVHDTESVQSSNFAYPNIGGKHSGYIYLPTGYIDLNGIKRYKDFALDIVIVQGGAKISGDLTIPLFARHGEIAGGIRKDGIIIFDCYLENYLFRFEGRNPYDRNIFGTYSKYDPNGFFIEKSSWGLG